MYTFLQQKEINLGYRHGLNKRQISVYANSKLNYKKMKILRKALEYGIPEIEVLKLSQSKLCIEEIEEKIECYKKYGKIDFKYKKVNNIIYYFISLVMLFLIMIYLIFYFHKTKKLPYRINHRDVKILTTDLFDIKSLVHVTGEVEVSYPKFVQLPGEYLLDFMIHVKDEIIHEYILIEVVSHEEKNFTLSIDGQDLKNSKEQVKGENIDIKKDNIKEENFNHKTEIQIEQDIPDKNIMNQIDTSNFHMKNETEKTEIFQQESERYESEVYEEYEDVNHMDVTIKHELET